MSEFCALKKMCVFFEENVCPVSSLSPPPSSITNRSVKKRLVRRGFTDENHPTAPGKTSRLNAKSARGETRPYPYQNDCGQPKSRATLSASTASPRLLLRSNSP